MKFKRIFNKIKYLSWEGILGIPKTIYLNLKLFPFSKAIFFPVIVSCKVKIRGCKRGSIEINSKLRPGMIEFGFGGSYDQKLYSNNKLIIKV